MNVKIVKLNTNATIPTQGSAKAAGFDLYTCLDNEVKIEPHSTAKIPTGLSIQPPAGYFGAIFARSGLASKEGLRPANCVGCCDEDYTGEYIVALHNDSDVERVVSPNERIAQLVFLPYISANFVEVDKLDNTERGSGGFGSTGK